MKLIFKSHCIFSFLFFLLSSCNSNQSTNIVIGEWALDNGCSSNQINKIVIKETDPGNYSVLLTHEVGNLKSYEREVLGVFKKNMIGEIIELKAENLNDSYSYIEILKDANKIEYHNCLYSKQ